MVYHCRHFGATDQVYNRKLRSFAEVAFQ